MSKKTDPPKPPPDATYKALAEWIAKFERVWGRKPTEREIRWRH